MEPNRFLNFDGYFKFGRYNGEPAREVARRDPKYLRWILRTIGDLPDDVAEELQDALVCAGEPFEEATP